MKIIAIDAGTTKTGYIYLEDRQPLDYGWVFQTQTGDDSQLRLGPIRRTFERQKFNKQGGYEHTPIRAFKDIKISEYVFFYGKRHKKVTNTTITQYATGDESNSLPPS